MGLWQGMKMQQEGHKGQSVSNKDPLLTSQASLCLIYFNSTYLLSAFYVPGTLLGSGDPEMKQTKASTSRSLHSGGAGGGKLLSKQVSK